MLASGWLISAGLLSKTDFSWQAKALGIWLPLVLGEPLLICLTGATLGQHALGLRVLGPRPPRFPMLVLRYWMKVVLGGISFAMALFDPQRRALHDLLVGAQVVCKGRQAGPGVFPRRRTVWRRYLVSLGWSLLGGAVLALLAIVAVGVALGLLSELLPGAAVAYEPTRAPGHRDRDRRTCLADVPRSGWAAPRDADRVSPPPGWRPLEESCPSGRPIGPGTPTGGRDPNPKGGTGCAGRAESAETSRARAPG